MNQPNPIRILLVDDDSLMVFALEKIIQKYRDLQVVGQVRNGYEALAFLQATQTDVVLLDIEMPHMNGIECLQQIRSLHPAIIVILLTTFAEEQYIIDGLANGAQSYLLKTTPFEYLGPHIREAINGTFIMPAPIAAKLATLLHQKKNFHEQSLNPLFFQKYEMTRAEQLVVNLLAKRLANPEIAEQLNITVGTVKNHLITIFTKLCVHNRQDAITLIETYLH
jgi:DNA-binding NarL/FixJ family response regulator